MKAQCVYSILRFGKSIGWVIAAITKLIEKACGRHCKYIGWVVAAK